MPSNLDAFHKNRQEIISNIYQISQKYQIPNKVCIIAVTKQKPDSWYPICISSQITHIGENRIEEIQIKNTSLVKLHFLGQLQSRKIKELPIKLYSLDTLSNIKHLAKLENHFQDRATSPLRVLLQIQTNKSTIEKAGMDIQDTQSIIQLAKKVYSSKVLKLDGLMGMGPTPTSQYNTQHIQYQNDTRKSFQQIRILKEQLEQEIGISLPRLSIGMSNDYQIAIQEKSTEIRIGSLLFGSR